MKFVFDPRTGHYVPENLLYRSGLSDVDKIVFDWLSANPSLPELRSYSTRSIAYDFFKAHPEVDSSKIEEVRDAIAKWNNANIPLMKPRATFESAVANPDYSEDYKGIEIRVNLAENGLPDGYIALSNRSQIASAPTLDKIRAKIDEYLAEQNDKQAERATWTYRRKLDPVNSRDVLLAQRNGLILNQYSNVYEYKDAYGFLHYTSNEIVATEDAGGAAPSAAPTASPSSSVAGPTVIDALSIPSPVLPKETKKKKKAAEGLKGYTAEGDCFTAAWKTFYDHIAENPLLCHGVVVGQGKLEGVKFAHAWVEVGDTVYDKTIPLFANGFPKDAYYRIARIDEDDGLVFRYDSKLVASKASKHKTAGPWETILWDYMPE